MIRSLDSILVFHTSIQPGSGDILGTSSISHIQDDSHANIHVRQLPSWATATVMIRVRNTNTRMQHFPIRGTVLNNPVTSTGIDREKRIRPIHAILAQDASIGV